MLTGDPALQTFVEKSDRLGLQWSDFLAGWSVEEKRYGIGTCVGCSGSVLCFGNWGVVGHTGHYEILFPSGWVEDHPVFKTELEAMLWVSNRPGGAMRPNAPS